MHQDIESRLKKVLGDIHLACKKINKPDDCVKLIAVSKLKPSEVINEAYDLGLRDFGENYAQELSQKSLSCPKDIIWHFMGPIQTNKIKTIAKHAAWVHSLDRAKVAMKLDAECKSLKKTISVLIQVNIDNEPTKSGVQPQDVISFAKELEGNYPHLKLEGLMFMPNINANVKDKVETYKNIISLQGSLLKVLPDCTQLSLGTSSDYEDAIIAGSTMIRLGEILLGQRS